MGSLKFSGLGLLGFRDERLGSIGLQSSGHKVYRV